MRKDKRARTVIWLCVAAAIVAVLIPTWAEMRAKWQILKGTNVLYLFMEEESETDVDTSGVADTDVREIAETTEKVYINPKTNFMSLLSDDAQLLDEEEEQELAAQMQGITAYGNVIFKTTDSGVWDTASYAGEYYREKIGTDSGMLFLIDMENRMIWIHCDGAVYQVITKSYADTITDNVYRYASDGDYYKCAAQVYGQALALLEGNRIAQPMKYISNALLAVILALLLNYALVCFFTGKRKPGRREYLGNAGNYFRYTEPKAFFVRETRTYHPTGSGGSGGSGNGGRNSGRNSGGSSSSSRNGGGGGHRF